MNLVKRYLVEGRIRGGIEAFKRVKVLVGASLFLIFNFLTRFWSASSSCFLRRSAEGLAQRLCQAQDPRAIMMEI